MDALTRDLRLALRSLVSVPSFTAIAVLTLAIGMGATTLMFSAANAAFLQPLPFRSGGLVHLWQVSQRTDRVAIPIQVWRDWQEGMTSFSSLAATGGATVASVSHGSDAERVAGSSVSGNFFETLGVAPALGRTFSAEETTPNGPPAAVISDRFWERFFGRDPGALGTTIQIQGVATPIVGVMPPGFSYPQNAELWGALERSPNPPTSRTSHALEVIGRLRPDASVRSAQAELEAVTRQLHHLDPAMGSEGFGVRVVDLREDLLGDSSRALVLLLIAVGCLLLMACANVVNLLLARSVARQTQTVMRVALGASRRDILRLYVAESLVLAIGGGALGLVLLLWSGPLIEGLVPPVLRPSGVLRADLTVFGLVAALMVAVGILCALLPVRYASRFELRAALASGAQNVAAEPRAMRAMVGVQAAVGVLLLVGAGLLAGSLMRLERVDPGFRRDDAVVASFSLGGGAGSKYQNASARMQFYDHLLERARTMPGVVAAGVTSSFPFAFSPNALLQEDGVPLGQWGQAPATEYRAIGGRYFEAMGTPLLRGRPFTDADDARAPLVAIVNEATVRILWNGEAPLGRRVRMANVDGVQEYATVVGVVGNMRHRGVARPAVSEVYFPYRQRPSRTWGLTLVAQTDALTAVMAGALREAVREIDPAMPISVTSIADRLDAQLEAARFRTALFAGFAITALVLASFGIVGAVSYSIAARLREMGIRIALGAGARDIRGLVLRRALTPVLIGLVAGLTGALFASRLVASLLFEVERTDPLTYVTAGGVLLLTAVLAAWWPARRAAKANPLAVLRTQ